ncbi:MAG: FAD-dependent oxidoreductase, partial [Actinomycetota bacterium]
MFNDGRRTDPRLCSPHDFVEGGGGIVPPVLLAESRRAMESESTNRTDALLSVVGGMTTITKHMANGLQVRYSSMVFSLSHTTQGWRVHLDDGSHHDSDHDILTCPIPQSMPLLVNNEIVVPDALRTNEYD